MEPLEEELLKQLESLSPFEEGSPEFHLPGENPFVPTDFGLRVDEETAAGTTSSDDEGYIRSLLPTSIPPIALETVRKEDWSRLIPPTLLTASGEAESSSDVEGRGDENAVVRVWHKMDRSYRVPRSAIAAKLWTPEPYGSPQGAALSRMFVRLLKEDLKSWAYDAAMADLRYSMEMTTHGLSLSVGGFSSKVRRGRWAR